MNFEKARFNMVHQQVRTWDVSNRRVLNALLTISREVFVPPEYRKLAYADVSIPLVDGQETAPPRIAARIAQALDPDPTAHVLEVGTGSGYLTALLAMLAKDVVSIEISPRLHQQARAALAIQNVRNTRVLVGDGTIDRALEAPFDAIVVTGSVPVRQALLERQLKENGRLFVVVGSEPVMEACLITRLGPGNWRKEVLFETILPPLRQSAPSVDAFVL
uniref:Protein-L-isoaspartate O-methyltransferase n=1 Tax=Candidatus Kentrum eta TaxID=2126337 RepID=A0A450UFH5_9GAMM|nr:MAG: protein-L-isoaspartate(D-aspartate) O-methyltransferase [Candidatus Kentron sp. H]VFJ91244.1 MAG: protein-L-isoaspartate(D-aspartate) O-methyltransferase [Candidatus Kentron sp. H]VFJ97674.1 MAG: protein-L-isoaspartate(D-aspartate) O-methyltransferase [Candidatus Kentron sp. H]